VAKIKKLMVEKVVLLQQSQNKMKDKGKPIPA